MQAEGRPSCSWKIRPATKQDVPSIVWLIQLLAEYENEPTSMKIGEKEVLRDGFGDSQPYFHVLIAELTSDDTSAVIPTVDPERPSTTLPHNDRIVGHALYFYTYCREGKCLYLQDLYVREEYRNRGIGTALLQECAKALPPLRNNSMYHRSTVICGIIVWRRGSLGTRLCKQQLHVACEEECARLQWLLLEWNTRAANLYERIGGKIMREWLPVVLTQPELGTFAAGKVSRDTASNKS